MRGRRVRENVRVEEKWLDPGGSERRDTAKFANEIRRGDEWGLNSMFIVAGRNQRDCATVIGSIRVWMNTVVQFRGSTQQQRPQERCRDEGYETSPTHIGSTPVHRAAIFRQRTALGK